MYQDTAAGIVEGYAQCGVPLLDDTFMFVNRMNLFLEDKLHPNDSGAKLMASTIVSQLVNGVSPYSHFGFSPLTGGGCIWTLDSTGLLTLDVVFGGANFTNHSALVGSLPIRLRAERNALFGSVYTSLGQPSYLWIAPNGDIRLYNETAGNVNGINGNAYVQYRLWGTSNNQEYNI